MTTGSQEQEPFITVELPKTVGVNLGVRSFVALLFCVAFLGASVVFASRWARRIRPGRTISLGRWCGSCMKTIMSGAIVCGNLISTGKEEFGHECPRKHKEFKDLLKRAMLAMHR